jgi:putative ABC transport system permease protein
MSRLLRRSSLRHWQRHPVQLMLAILGIALGVAIVVSVDLATGSARRAFELSSEAAFGRADYQIVPGPAGIPDTAYRRIRLDLHITASPIVDAWGRIASGDVDLPLHLLGVDPFAEAPFRPWVDATSIRGIGADIIARQGALLLSPALAARLGVRPGDSVRVEINGQGTAAYIAGTIEPRGELSRRALGDLALADISTAQELTGRPGRLDRVDVRLAGEVGERALTALRGALPAGASLVETGARTRATADMTRAFSLNLAAFAWITLVFGTLLIYDTMTFSIVQRRQLIGLLRAIGVSRREIARFLLAEAFTLGAAGTVLGIALGAALGSVLVGLVARTINDLYFRVSVAGVTLAPVSILKGLGLGLLATLLATLPPMREALTTQPRAVLVRTVLEERVRRGVGTAFRAGLLILAGGLVLLRAPGRSLALGFVSLFAVVAAGALMAPGLTIVLMRVLRPLAKRGFGFIGNMAVGGVPATLSRTAPAISALVVAVSVGSAVGIMVGSFRHSVERWLDTSLQADLYVASPGTGSRGVGVVGKDWIERVRAAPGVEGLSTLRQTSIPFGDNRLTVVAVDLFPRHRDFFTFLEGGGAGTWRAFDAGAVLVSESFAWRNRASAGDTIRLMTETGPQPFEVAGVFRDYASEFGVVFMDRGVYDRFWDDDAVSSLAVFLQPGANPDSVAARLTTSSGAGPPPYVRSNRGLREATLEVFDRTFVITGVLRILALVVAFVGVLSSLMALQFERGRELGVLRAVGLTPGQLRVLVSSQTGLMGLAAGLLAAPLSLGLAWMLIHVVNRRSFGWTLELRADAPGLGAAILIAVAAALLAGIWPAARMARTPPAAALREE